MHPCVSTLLTPYLKFLFSLLFCSYLQVSGVIVYGTGLRAVAVDLPL